MPRILNLSGAGNHNPVPVSYHKIENDLTTHSNEKSELEIQKVVNTLLQNQEKQYTYPIKDASKLLGVSEEFLRRRVIRGDIHTIKFGDKPMITVFEIAKLIITGVN